jgi:cytochrome d ubiquinol oxidase subunit II
MEFDLPLIWAGVIAFGVIMYVVMDGFDLGVGILFPFFPERRDRDQMMNSVAPIWDGNETWMVLGGAGLFGAFPLAYAVILPALYLPLILMLIALIFRGVAFEFRFKSNRTRFLWDIAFSAGSLVATFAQGVALGGFIQGFTVVDRSFAGGSWDWLTPFSLFVGLALAGGYAMLGCGWLIMKTEGDLQARVYRAMPIAGLLTLAAIGIVSLWTPLAHPAIAERWFSWPNLLILSPVPLLVLVAIGLLWRALERKREVQPFLLTLALFLISYAGLAISLWPNVIPPSISIWEAASPPESQGFLLVGVLILVPIILAYTAYAYWVFRGKVPAEGHYH